jgi:hypothetical protein
MKKSNFLVPITIVAIIIVIIFYLIASTDQPNVTCSISRSDDLNVKIQETVKTKLSSRKIIELNIKKEYIFPNKLNKESNINMLKNLLDNSLEYLGDDQDVYTKDNVVTVNIITKKKNPVLLDNVEFTMNDGLSIKVNTNTKSDVTKLSVGEEYSEGELLTYLKNRGYSCQ